MARRQPRRVHQVPQEEVVVVEVVEQEEVHRNSTTTIASRTLARQHRPLATQAATLRIPAHRTRTRRTAHQPGHRREAICRAGHRQACIIRAQGTAALLDRPGR